MKKVECSLLQRGTAVASPCGGDDGGEERRGPAQDGTKTKQKVDERLGGKWRKTLNRGSSREAATAGDKNKGD